MVNSYKFLLIPFICILIQVQSFGIADSAKWYTQVMVESKTTSSSLPDVKNESKWSSYVGMGIGYLPHGYHEFTPTSGVYYRDALFNELLNSAFINIIYRDILMLENRLAIMHNWGRYHDYYNMYYNHVYLGFNPLSLIKNNKVTHSFYIKYGFGVTNNCTCGYDVPFVRPGMTSRGLQFDYFTPLNDFLNLHISFGNIRINSDIPGKYNFTHWHAGVALRLL